MNQIYKRGDIYFADLGAGIGSEQMGYRPVVIIQNDTGNKHSPTVVVAAVTSKVDAKAKQPTHCFIGAGYGLELPSVILLEQLRTLDKQRLEKYVGRLSDEHLHDMNHALAISVGLIPIRENLVLCLCKPCADNFRLNGKYDLVRVTENQERDTCTYCNHRMGYEYELVPRK
ncbi:type II toxin-antitoxin system PemK/MazF family toxin [Pseudoramibacter faecis]|uniref:type II toxin-antitoxin system PemK/MazF family toxin n=1 Tax=Pseudoramibacter faecis TaxID=3108534 RepID=UPI002E7A0617|nr:type II toxin-antitoxin system PemK/MazF family toxin [Pseudoramibacter sp. HA2172]